MVLWYQRKYTIVKTLFSFEGSTWRFRAYSSAGLERTPDKREVDGSSPFRPIYGELAQLGEHLLCKQEVIGSIPLTSIDRDVILVP